MSILILLKITDYNNFDSQNWLQVDVTVLTTTWLKRENVFEHDIW